MPLKTLGVIEIPGGANSDFDHAALDPQTRRVFIAHTARDCIEVIDHDARKHIATLPGFPGVAGAVADDGDILTTNRGAATITWFDAATYRVESIGQNRTERLISLVLLGDLVSLYLAVLREVDPTPVPNLDRLKSALARG